MEIGSLGFREEKGSVICIATTQTLIGLGTKLGTFEDTD